MGHVETWLLQFPHWHASLSPTCLTSGVMACERRSEGTNRKTNRTNWRSLVESSERRKALVTVGDAKLALVATASAFLAVGFASRSARTHDEFKSEFVVATNALLSRN